MKPFHFDEVKCISYSYGLWCQTSNYIVFPSFLHFETYLEAQYTWFATMITDTSK